MTYKIGDKVRVIDCSPSATGEIVEVSTKQAVLGPPANDTPYYKAHVPEWPNDHWFGEMHLTSA